MAADAARVSSSKNCSPAAAPARRRKLATPGGLSLVAVALGAAAYLLVPRMVPAYGGVGTDQGVRLTSSSVVVGEGDTGSVTVQGELTEPAGAAVRCVRVRFAGARPGRIDLHVDVGRRPSAVGVVVERGTGTAAGASGACAGFQPATTMYRGPLSGLTTPIAGWAAQPGAEAVYRFTFTAGGTGDASTSVSALFLWSAVRPSGSVPLPTG